MPLPPCNTNHKYKHLFFTAGPLPSGDLQVKSDFRVGCQQAIVDVLGLGKIEKMRIVQEVGETGYHHLHVAMILTKELRWLQINNTIKKYVTRLGATDNASCRAFYVRKGEDPHCIFKYIENPTKVKVTDSESLEFESSQVDPTILPYELEGDRNFMKFVKMHHLCKLCGQVKPVFSRKCLSC